MLQTDPQFQTRRIFTGKTYFLDDVLGATQGTINLGDNNKLQYAVAEKTTEISIPDKGFRRKVRALPIEIAWEYELTVGQMFGQIIAAVYRGTQTTDTTQALVAAPTGTASIAAAILGATYLLGVYDMVTVVVTNNAVVAVLGVDYTIDLGSGAFYVIPTSTVISAMHVTTFTYGCAAIKLENYVAWNNLVQTGNFTIHEFDQFDQAPAAIHAFHGQIMVKTRGESDGKKQIEPVFTLLADAVPTIQYRK